MPTGNTPSPFAAPDANRHQMANFPVAALVILHFATCGIFSFIWLNLQHGKMPKVRTDDPSATRAIGFCLIPIFNLYWFFVTSRRLCLRVDEQRESYGLPPSKLKELAAAACIMNLIPFVNLLNALIFWPLFAGRMQSSINELVRVSAGKAQQQPVPAIAPPGGSSAGFIALVVALCLIPIVYILAGLLIAPASAHRAAQRIICINNLREVGLAFKIWEGDHGDQYPFNVSTNRGGTKELIVPDEAGWDRNSWVHLQVMSNELVTSKALHCPGDDRHQLADTFAQLDADHCSYLVYANTYVNDANPQAVLAICPVHFNVLFADGSVRQCSPTEFNQLTNTLARQH